MLWNKEAFLSHLCFDGSPREMVVELFGLLIGTEERWRAQGATPAEIELTAFAWDRVPMVWLAMNHGPLSGIEETLLSETDNEKRVRDRFGRTMVLPKKTATIALPQDFPVAGAADWQRIRHWFRQDESRLDQARLAQCAEQGRQGAVVRAGIWGAYDILRQLMGDENACMCVIEEPELVGDILHVMGDLQAQTLERVIQSTRIDVLHVHEDFAGKSGPLVGPNVIRTLFNPYYQRMWEIARRGGARLFDIDSDGFVEPVVDALLEGGINCLHPVEPAAGTDMVRLRRRYGGRLTLRGGIDKFALTRGKAAIDAELDYRLDACLREQLGLPAVDQDEPGWCRMA